MACPQRVPPEAAPASDRPAPVAAEVPGAPTPAEVVPAGDGRMKVSITYCVPCAYDDMAASLAAAIEAERPDADIELVGEHDEPGTFNVFVDGKQLWNKNESGGFPEHAELISRLPPIKSRS